MRFRRLFEFAVNKSCSMAYMFSLGWEDGPGARHVGEGDVYGPGRKIC